jgi:hypothetical protein
MKYVWLILVVIGIAGIYLGIQRYQLDHTSNFGGYPCFPCSSAEPDYEIVVFSSPFCDECEGGIQRVQRFCRLTGVFYGSTFYDDSAESSQKLGQLGLEKHTDFLVVVLKGGIVIKTDTNPGYVEQFLSETIKEASQL